MSTCDAFGLIPNELPEALLEELQKLKDEIGLAKSEEDNAIADVRPGAGGAASGAAYASRELGAMGAEARRAGRVGALF